MVRTLPASYLSAVFSTLLTNSCRDWTNDWPTPGTQVPTLRLRSPNTLLTTRGNTHPILFVDVDGVISLFGFDPHNPPAGVYHSINGVLHYISRDAGKRLTRLTDRYELVWATGWEEAANDYLPQLLGLPGELPCLSFDSCPQFGTSHWKIAAIDTYAGPRPLAWIDDSHDESCRQWAAARAAPTLLVRTACEAGIADEHVERLLSWASGLAD
jgi:hypothetical protein